MIIYLVLSVKNSKSGFFAGNLTQI